MKVKCIENYGFYDNCLTIGKTYDVIKKDNNGDYWIINDKGEEDWFPEDCFKLLSEYRIKTINKLLE
jgi:hypothetical protein